MSIRTIGVVGAGVMGTGVAQALAQAGHRVVLADVTEEKLAASLAGIRKGLRLRSLLEPGTRSREKPGAVLERVHPTVDLGRLEAADFVIENVTEKWPIKEKVYRQMDRLCPPHTIFAVNTSAIPITRVASVTGRAPQVLGMHFMNPVPLKPMVEVIRGYHTAPETIDVARELLAGMGKECIVVEDSPGFVTNRVMMLTINEAIFLLHENVAATPEDVDRLFKTCFGHRMGPLETADLIGLDTILYSIDVLYENFNDDKYRPCPLLKKMVDAGVHGRKSGRGFYAYPEAARPLEDGGATDDHGRHQSQAC